MGGSNLTITSEKTEISLDLDNSNIDNLLNFSPQEDSMRTAGVVSVLLAGVLSLPLFAAVRGQKARYAGGTIAGIAENTKGVFDQSREDAAVFTTKDGKKIVIPYKNIESLEYGQKAGRRVGVALAVSPLFLLSKKRKHYLSIRFQDEQGQSQGAVFELAKGIVRSTLANFETRSGKQIEYESEEAKKHAGN
jgi:hypothetical protein